MKTEKQKMLAGELYDASDVQLRQDQKQARKLMQRLNVTDYANAQAYAEIISSLLPNVSNDIHIEPPFYCDYGYNIHAGENVFFNFNCVLLDVMPIKIGAHVMFGPAVQISTATHPLDAGERRKGPESAKPISIDDDCWIGGGVIINPGVNIGARCIVGAGAIVTKDIPADSIVAGNPARPLSRHEN